MMLSEFFLSVVHTNRLASMGKIDALIDKKVVKRLKCLDKSSVVTQFMSDYRVVEKEPLLITGEYIYSGYKDCCDSKEHVVVDYQLPDDRFVVYSECCHNGEWLIECMNDICEVESFILGDAGFFNMFVGRIVVYGCGKDMAFRLMDKNSNRVIEQLDINDLDDTEEGKDYRVEWI